ncbi:MAG: hypothetical protein ABF888_08290 [Acetobacter papayae]
MTGAHDEDFGFFDGHDRLLLQGRIFWMRLNYYHIETNWVVLTRIRSQVSGAGAYSSPGTP